MGPQAVDQDTLLLVAVLVTAGLIVAGVLLALNFQTLRAARVHEATLQPAVAGTSRSRRRQARSGVGAVTRDEQEGTEESAVPAAQGAGTSSRTSAKKRRGRARRQQEGAANGRLDDVDEEADEQGSDLDEPVAFSRSAYDIAREEKEREREEQEAIERERIRKEQDLKRKQEQAEFAKWKGQFSVDETGQEAPGVEQVQQRRDDFCGYIKRNKMVELQDLSLMFGMTCSEVVAEIHHLEEEGQLTGVLDDRGKYIYLSMQELQSLAALIKSEGRISISRLAQEATSLLNIVPPGIDSASGLGDDSVLDEILA